MKITALITFAVFIFALSPSSFAGSSQAGERASALTQLRSLSGSPESLPDIAVPESNTPVAAVIPVERARDMGIRIGIFEPGPLDAITDVKGVRVGHVTLKSGDGKLVPGEGPVRTGVTAIIPADGNVWESRLRAGSFVLNGNGEGTGLMYIQETGSLETPIALTNTLSVADVQKGLLEWLLKQNPGIGIAEDTALPVVFECDDSSLNDIQGFHVKPEHAIEALDMSSAGPVAEGAVGAGTGMITYEFKGGIGTASRKVPEIGAMVGVLVNANHGDRRTLRIGGAAVGEEITDLLPLMHEDGSIVVIVATDAPLDPRQLSRLAKRAFLGVARTGAVAHHGSGDIALAFSTANRVPRDSDKPTIPGEFLSDDWIDGIFEATADAAEEAVINALLGAETTVGRDGNTAYALPHDRLKEILKRTGVTKSSRFASPLIAY